MANPRIALFAEANRLGIEGYRAMSEDDLHAAIKTAKAAASSPSKGKTQPTNGSADKSTAEAAVKDEVAKPVKGKTTPAKGRTPATDKTVKSAPVKSTTRKSTRKTGAAAKGAQTKRPATGGKTKTATKTKTRSTAKTTAAKTTTNRGKSFAAKIDNRAVDWKAETTIGSKGGKRQDVMKGLRRYNGEKVKVYNLLADNAKTYFPGKPKAEAERLLVWLIGRVAFDFVMETGQHKPGKRAAWGTSSAEQDVRRRQEREDARKAVEKAERAAARSGGTKSQSAARKPAAGRTGAQKGKTKTAARKTGRKTAARR